MPGASKAVELLEASQHLAHYGLVKPAKWAAQLAYNIDPHAVVQSLQSITALDSQLLFAKTLFDCKEYMRAAKVLEDCQVNSYSLFIKTYAMYLDGHKHLLEGSGNFSAEGILQKQPSLKLKDFLVEVGEIFENASLDHMDAFCRYLYGVVLSELGNTIDAQKQLIKSVESFPLNWSAWEQLALLCENMDMINEITGKIRISNHWIISFFQVEALNQLHATFKAFEVLEAIQSSGEFPFSSFLYLQSALIAYNDRSYDHAQALFEDIRERDPYSLDHIDTFSNILYVKNEQAALSFLAHDSIKIEQYCPETCCVVGNYYSLKGQHQKAISYFQKALKLDPYYLSAWTLMGHEYVELRNAPAAIAAYRRAVEINPKDYRAWYGLGQTYEIQQLFSFSLYYFKKATDLRPHDARMWCAMGDTYQNLGRIELSIKCFLNARSRGDREGVSISKLAKLYHQELNNLKQAEQYYLEMLELGFHEDEDLALGLISLAQMYKDGNEYSKAESYCNRVLALVGAGGLGTGASKDQARSLLKEVMTLRHESEESNVSDGSDMDED